MDTLRMHINFPRELALQIDEIAGERGRSAFLVEVARVEVKRRRLGAILDQLKKEPAWKDEDHPDIVKLGTAGWVRKIRETDSPRKRRIEKAFKRK